MLRLAVLIGDLAAVPRDISVVCGGQPVLVHILLGVGSAVKALRQQAGLWDDAVPDSQFPAILRQV